ncbi:hypothetical protein NQZ68_005953 [Dissostichus eleginoides]|nr:hypothetical protein NQZ68_005953 [Dissostichus eleginoides]
MEGKWGIQNESFKKTEKKKKHQYFESSSLSSLPFNKAAQEILNSTSEDLSRDAWLAAAWRQEWELAGPSCIHRYIWDPGDGAIGGDDLPRWQWTHTKPSTNWGRSFQNINEEVGPGRQCCMRVRPPSEASLFDSGPEMRAWLHDTELDL